MKHQDNQTFLVFVYSAQTFWLYLNFATFDAEGALYKCVDEHGKYHWLRDDDFDFISSSY